MKNALKAINLSSVILLIFSSILFAQKQRNSEKTDAPILDYEVEIQKPISKERQKINKHFDSYNVFFGGEIKELPAGVEPLPTITHWWLRLPALPVTQSTAIILGQITDAEAHLSNNKTTIYSEFSVRVEEMFKDTSNSINLNNLISVNRLGGTVRFASGRISKYTIHRQGMPQKGERYLLFLNQLEGNFIILTGYKIAENQVSPLDGEDSRDPRSDLPFAQYRNIYFSRFLQDLQIALKSLQADKQSR